MDASELESCLGKVEDSPEVVQLLTSLGVKKGLKHSRDGDTYVERPELGLVLVFKPVGPKSSKFKLMEIQFNSDTEKGYTNFSGTLPNNVKWNDTQEEVRKKLGKPTKAMKEFHLDHWIKGNRRLSVEYRKSFSSIANVALGFPIEE